MSPASGSVAITAITRLTFSARVAAKPGEISPTTKAGGRLVAVAAVADCDQAPAPSSFSARTCTSYAVSGARSAISAPVAVTSCGPTVQAAPVPVSR